MGREVMQAEVAATYLEPAPALSVRVDPLRDPGGGLGVPLEVLGGEGHLLARFHQRLARLHAHNDRKPVGLGDQQLCGAPQ